MIYINDTKASKGEPKIKEKIISAYKENHKELIANYGQTEEEYYCKGYEEALNFVMSLMGITPKSQD